MTTADLRTLIASSVKVADMGDREYVLEGTGTKVDGKTLGGNGAKITRIIDAGAPRVFPGISVRGRGSKLTGTVEYVGAMPTGGRFDESREGHHAIEVDGAVDAIIEGGWHVHNHSGDAVTVMTTSGAHDPWTQNLRLTGMASDEIGRHHVTIDALQVGLMAGLTMGRSDLSPVDIEPPGGSWGCRKLTWLNTIITDTGGGATLANKGEGGSDTVQDIYLGGIRCLYRPFSVTVNPIPKPGHPVIRRQRFKIVNCSGAGTANQPQIVARHLDGLYVRNVRQRLAAGVRLIRCIDCDPALIDVDVPFLAA